MTLKEKIENASPGAIMISLGATAFLALLPSWINYDVISNDGAFQYIPIARMFLEGRFIEALSHPQLPFFPMIMVGVAKLTGFDLELSGRLASSMGYILAAIGTFKLSEAGFKNRWISLIAVLLLLTNRQLVNRSVDCLKESLLISCIVWGNYLVIKGVSGAGEKWKYYASGAAVLLTGALFRSTSLVFVSAWLIIWVFHERKGVFARSSVFIAPLATGLIAWGVYPELPVVPLFKKSCYTIGYFFIASRGAVDILKSSLDVIRTFLSTGNPIAMLFGIYGLYRYGRNLYFFHTCLVLSMFFLILIFWPYASSRYFLAPIIWLYPLAAYGIVSAFEAKNPAPKVLGGIAVASSVVLWAHLSLTPPDPDRLAWKEAGRWILYRLGENREIVSNRDRLVFYAKGNLKPLSVFHEARILRYIVAVDTEHEGGKDLERNLQALGIGPDRKFRSVLVYLPKPRALTK